MARVELKKVRKVFPGGVEAVKGADLVIEDKEFVVLVGPSGCGKSTTLRMIAGLEEITDGEIYIDGKIVNDVPPKNRDIAMVFQNYALYPHMTVYKNMAFGLILRKYPKKEIQARVQAAAEILGIQDLLDRKPKALSGGQRQRVAVGRAIVRQPKVFLFDEPLSNLDAKLRVQMRAEISKLHTRLQSTMIYVTHDQVEAMTMGDRIVVMLDGVIQQVADPLTLYNKPVNKFVAGFIGSPPMNMVDGRLSAENGSLRFRDLGGSLDLEVAPPHRDALQSYVGKQVTLGIRPEDVRENITQTPVPGSSITANVEVVEPMGSEIYLYIGIGGKSLTARIKSNIEPEVNKPYVIDVLMDKVHYFDAATEKTII
ncbi:MAG TPA: sn-glycerol-3-phosphate ABC transporter ATP-binding protein UgpC [Candidatus Hydrogenedentes bacterium]|nr:sn-glycerol-3-phosphate ABC transporter ATP-binding protein UgpC [Candidatus Hydrogenedentota bacterium]HOT49792.1 sn-glycerol-3-phosphate ABC transporter ATP-binding protein UgpC [Candidatus Hydrogenedentota bacterium]HOV74989.1 sn-glycerol-3-phosphate ABC transporter ATP-binding protein UgpC [Candidatus Hydrogenedentota bacterium]HPC16759.1 sn-glycerol-3-phosphate ABC transporter ATP-binding protein UgpC [Candidatus Hydrogenedentota bacterium]HRT21394.1 sn-glycerol-3-phosphate ABC transpor